MTDAVPPWGPDGGRLVGRVTCLLVTGLLLAACGGGSGERPAADPSRSGLPSATASVPSPTQSVTRTRTARPSPPATPADETPTPEGTPIEEPTQSQAPPPTEAETPPSEPTRPRPTRSPAPQPSPTASPTRTDVASPTPDKPRATLTATVTAKVETQQAETKPEEAAPEESPSASPSNIDVATVSGETAMPPWAWLVLALLALGLGAPLMVRSRRRRAWQSELTASEREVAWLARDLVPSLRRTGSMEGAVGGWAVSSARVVALEDRLTGLEGQAPDNVARDRARSLRDAVRTAKARLDGLADAPAGTEPRPVLDEAVDVLEAVLHPVAPVGPGER